MLNVTESREEDSPGDDAEGEGEDAATPAAPGMSFMMIGSAVAVLLVLLVLLSRRN